MSWEDTVKKALTESTPDEITMGYKPRVVKLLQDGILKVESADNKNTLIMSLEMMEKLCSTLKQSLGK